MNLKEVAATAAAKEAADRLLDRYIPGEKGSSTSDSIVPLLIMGTLIGGGILIWSFLNKRETTWEPVLLNTVNTGEITATPSFAGWQPALNSLIYSPAITAIPSLAGWQPALNSLIYSPAITAIIAGWQPALNSLVSVNCNTGVTDWLPVLTSLAHTSINTGGFILNVSVDPSGAGFITLNPLGESVGDVFYYAPGTIVYATAQVFNPAAYSFLGWYNLSGTRVTTNPTLTINMNLDATFIARFQYIYVPPEGPQFPAPGVIGDGQYWYWIVFSDSSSGWYSEADYVFLINNYPPEMFSGIYGPYPSGATG
jgi:hypothetical protein